MLLNNKLQKIIVVFLCSSTLLGCTSPPKPKPKPTSVRQLISQVEGLPIEVNQPSVAKPIAIAELTASRPDALKELNQKGEAPTVTTINEHSTTLAESDLSDDDPIQLDFDQVALQQVVQIIADALNISVIIDPTIADKVTIRTAPDKPLTKKDLWPLLQMLLKSANTEIEKKGDVYHIKKKTTIPTLPGTVGMTPESLTGSLSEQVMQVTPLRYITAEAAVTVINPLVQPKGRVITLPTLNFIGIITTPARLRRVNQLLKVIDANPFLHRGMRLFRLFNSKATEVQAELDKILKAISGGKTPSTYQVISLERINAVLVIAPPNSGFNKVATWVDILDERIEETHEQVFVYKVKNLEAKKLAATLSNAFKIEDKKALEEKEKLKRRREQLQAQGRIPATPPSAPLGLGVIPVSAELRVTIVADEATNSLLIRATPRDYRQLLETIILLDQVPKEVMINVVIAEVSLTNANRFGIDWTGLITRSNGGNAITFGSNPSVPTGNFPLAGTTSDTTDKDTKTGTNALASLGGGMVNLALGTINLNVLLNLVSSTSNMQILSRPSLLVRNNEEASINVGSNEPYLGGINTSSVQAGQMLSNDVQYKDTGITIKVTPRINDDGIINMKIFQELSQLGPTRTTQNLQSFIQRKIETSVVVRDGTGIIIGGLIKTITNDDKQGIPGLQDIPVVGDKVFSSTKQNEERTELVLIILPNIVNPVTDNRPLLQQFKRRMQLVSDLLNKQQVFVGEIADVPVPMHKPVPEAVPSENPY